MRLVVVNHILMEKVAHVDVLAVQHLKIGCPLLLLTIYPVTAIVITIEKSYSQLGSIIGNG
jgi:hypothetical protein